MSNSDDATDSLRWITLSRLAEGNLTRQGEHDLDGGTPLPPYLIAPVLTLLTEGLLAVADPDPAGWQQVAVTEAGQNRHEQLGRYGAGGVEVP